MNAVVINSLKALLFKVINSFFLVLFFTTGAFSQNGINLQKHLTGLSIKPVSHYHYKGKKLFGRAQNINILSIPLDQLDSTIIIDLAWRDSLLLKTSDFAGQSDAIAAVNAGFFNVSKGGSATYLEAGDEMVSRRSRRGDNKEGPGTNLNAAIIISRHGKPIIEEARAARDYLNSNMERFVLITGPLLLKNREKTHLTPGSFVNNRHPRTSIGISPTHLFLIAVDGRHRKAKGMSLYELQDFLLDLECYDAINLDGGGSTTMWIKSDKFEGVVNCPSDNRKFDNLGERPVANAILLLKN